MKRIVRRKLQIPANVQPISNPIYGHTFDKGTEEATIMLTRFSNDSSGEFTGIICISTKDAERPFPRELVLPEKYGVNNSVFRSTYTYTFDKPTLFHPSITWEFFFTQVQSQPVTIDIISLITDNEYFYN